ncbi:hypothetical protein OpiT1DRAFT_04335 [Opitutaceae bacterium TAV1]|nr:hypothetical protein OpiT1DRAFT_04335 [Opitutaceae bacterium TAV1]
MKYSIKITIYLSMCAFQAAMTGYLGLHPGVDEQWRPILVVACLLGTFCSGAALLIAVSDRKDGQAK